MKKLILTAVLLAFSPLPAWAESDLALCKLRSQHVASPDTVYRPGVDVNGQAVVVADVNAAPSMAPDVVRIPMTVDLAQRLGSVPAGAEMKAAMGMIEIHKDGRVSFNGQDMTEVAVVLCDRGATAAAPVAVVPAQGTVTVPAVPAAPVAPAVPLTTADKIVVPADAPALPVATVPVAPRVQQPVVSRITTDMDAGRVVIPANAMATKPLPPHTLGQFIVPARKAPESLQPAVETAPAAPQPQQPMGERTNQDLEREDGIIWGQGN